MGSSEKLTKSRETGSEGTPRRRPGVTTWASLALPLLFCLPFTLGSTTTDSDNFRPDVIYCEEAVSRLKECCPDPAFPNATCDYYYSATSTSCESGTETYEYPVFALDTSKCILNATCDSLVAAGICERAAATYARSSSPHVSTPHPYVGAVCP